MTVDLVEGWTGPLDFNLLADDDVPATSMSGMSAELALHDEYGNAIEITGIVEINDPDAWRVRYTPSDDDLAAGRYTARFKITDGSGAVVYFPNGEADKWIVREA